MERPRTVHLELGLSRFVNLRIIGDDHDPEISPLNAATDRMKVGNLREGMGVVLLQNMNANKYSQLPEESV
jgi:hypothetical protein